jgi:hypothetical protein
MNDCRIVALFVKAPIPGRVKTRLARDIGDEAACSIYSELVERVVQQIQASGFPLALFFDGDEDALPDRWKRHACCRIRQQGDDLGERMAHAFRQLFDTGYQSVLLCGSDIPGIDAAYLQQAIVLLHSHDLIIGPALDGGYCLIGFHRHSFTSTVFEQIPWSTAQVLALTLAAAESSGLSIGMLPALRDIDTLDDLQNGIEEGTQKNAAFHDLKRRISLHF